MGLCRKPLPHPGWESPFSEDASGGFCLHKGLRRLQYSISDPGFTVNFLIKSVSLASAAGAALPTPHGVRVGATEAGGTAARDYSDKKRLLLVSSKSRFELRPRRFGVFLKRFREERRKPPAQKPPFVKSESLSAEYRLLRSHRFNLPDTSRCRRSPPASPKVPTRADRLCNGCSWT